MEFWYLHVQFEVSLTVLGELPRGKFPLVKLPRGKFPRGEFPRGIFPRRKLPHGKLPRIYQCIFYTSFIKNEA